MRLQVFAYDRIGCYWLIISESIRLYLVCLSTCWSFIFDLINIHLIRIYVKIGHLILSQELTILSEVVFFFLYLSL